MQFTIQLHCATEITVACQAAVLWCLEHLANKIIANPSMKKLATDFSPQCDSLNKHTVLSIAGYVPDIQRKNCDTETSRHYSSKSFSAWTESYLHLPGWGAGYHWLNSPAPHPAPTPPPICAMPWPQGPGTSHSIWVALMQMLMKLAWLFWRVQLLAGTCQTGSCLLMRLGSQRFKCFAGFY